ncbi:MAG: WYL domain-containing protein [Pasteurella sp.]|nr:WYL domain-containing protein [Pasteurella sp.]
MSKIDKNTHKEAQKTALLLLEILHHIPKRGQITAQEIHQRLISAGHNLTLRTVQRHLKDICQQFDIECNDTSKPYGYRWLEKAESFALPNLTPQESLLLNLAEKQLAHLLPTKVFDNLSGFFEQARKNLHPLNSEYPEVAKQWKNKVRVVADRQPLLPPDIDENVFDTVSNALYYNHWLEISYQKINGDKSNPIIMPLGLAQQGERMYLVCRYQGFNNERSLAIHRIKDAKMLTQQFKYPNDFSLEQYDNNGHFLLGHGKQITLKFNIKPERGIYLYETPLSADQIIIDNKDYLAITATVIDSKMLTWWLNSFADDIWDITKQMID